MRFGALIALLLAQACLGQLPPPLQQPLNVATLCVTCPAMGGGPMSQSVTNAEKLSLPLATALGTEVAVSDGFYGSGFGDARDGFFFANGVDEDHGHTRYLRQLPFLDDGTDAICVDAAGDGTQWNFRQNGSAVAVGIGTATDAPWQDDFSGSGLTLTHPAHQQLAAPGGGAVAVSGSTQDGDYTRRTAHANLWALVGVSDASAYEDGQSAISRQVGTGWFFNDGSGTLVYYSTQDVATPGLVTEWRNASDDTVAAITVALTDPQGGVFVAGGTQDGVFTERVGYNAGDGTKPHYNLLGAQTGEQQSCSWGNGQWIFEDGDPSVIYYSLSDVATPDLASDWKNASDDSSADITVTSVTVGQLGAGLRIGDDTYRANGSENGRVKYSDVLAVAGDVLWNPAANHGDGGWEAGGALINTFNVAFPFQGTPDVEVLEDPIADEANWQPVTP